MAAPSSPRSRDGDFVHLHVHTEYSMLDGAARLRPLFAEVSRLGMPAVAMTDHGNLFGAYDFYQHAIAAEVKPIIGCLLPGQEIITSDGVKGVEDVQVGDYVLTHRGRFRQVTRAMRRRYVGRAYTVALAGRYGRTLTLTEEHPILVREANGLVDWKKPGDISYGRRTAKGGIGSWNSWACLPRLAEETEAIDLAELLSPSFKASDSGIARSYQSKYRADETWHSIPRHLPLDYDLGYLLGIYAAEGSLRTRRGEITGGINFCLGMAEDAIATKIGDALLRFDVATQQYRRAGKGTQEVIACNVPLAHLFQRLVGCGAKNKRVPACVLSGPGPVRHGFLDGLLDGDGRNPDRESNSSGRRDVKLASRSLAWGVRTLLADLGHWVSVSTGKEKGRFPQGVSERDYRWYHVSYMPRRSYSRTLADTNYIYRPIRDVVAVELDCEVFNLQVEEDNSYVSDFVLHNCEAYVAPESRFHKRPVSWGEPHQRGDDISGGGAYTHLTLLAADAEGLRNLFRLSSRASIEGFYQRPRMDWELLAEYAGGVIASTGCPGGEVQTRLRLGQYDQAVVAAAKLRDIFGPENVFLELMDHGGEVERRVRDDLLRLGKELGLPPLATNDTHYVVPDESKAHEALLCVQTGKTLADPTRLSFDGAGYYIKSAAEMRALFDSGVPEACDNTLLVAERVGDYTEVFAARDLMPRVDVPAGETEDTWLRAEARRGLADRYPGGVPDSHARQAEYELDVVSQMGFPGYFLVVADLCRHARAEGIRVGPGRGSAAGSMVSYALRITDLDPIAHGLSFERFLNPDRITMPDIDLDFDERRRGDMIRYATEKYGAERVAQIITYGTIKAKAAIKDAARVLGYPYALGDRMTKAMPPAVMGKDIPLSGIFDPSHPRHSEAAEFRALRDAEPDAASVVETARGLEGLIRQAGVHAAGVILSREPLLDVLPIWRRDNDGAVITGWDMGACESIGLLKMDFLGLRNLTVLDDCLESVAENQGEQLALEELALDDRAAYDLLARGDTLGVFQLDGGPMRSLLRSLAPDSFEDISAVVALYRPGPMGANAHNDYADRKNGRKPVVPLHPELADALADTLGDTYGLIVYQEQVMAIAQQVAGYTAGQADLLRRAMGKKKKEILDKEFEPFAAGMRQRSYSDGAIKTLWDILIPFSDYAFNKSHGVAYGLVAYWTAFLKANYPSEYLAALLTSVADDKDKSAVYLAECRRMGIKVLPPDVNASGARFTAVGQDIRFGLAAVRNVGTGVVESIVRVRREQGEFTDFYDFLRKVDAVVCNKRTVESLIKAGAFDSLGHPRKGLLAVHADAIDSYLDVKRNEAVGQFDLFGAAFEELGGPIAAPPVPAGEWDKADLLAFEREMLGLYVSDHPLRGVEHVLAAAADHAIPSLLEEGAVSDGAVVNLAGILSGVQRRITKQGKAWAQATLEDLAGGVEVLFFPNTYELVGQWIAEDAIVVVRGRVDRRDEQPRLIAMDLSLPDLSVADQTRPVVLALPANRCTPPLVDRLKEVLASHPGRAEVHLKLVNGSRATLLRLGRLRVEPTTALMADLKALLGPTAVTA